LVQTGIFGVDEMVLGPSAPVIFHSWRHDLKGILQKRRNSLIFIFRSFNQLIFIGFYFCPKNSHSVTRPHTARGLAGFPGVANKVIHRNCE